MSNQKVATDFDLIIQADRQRRKNEELAKSIFSKKPKNDAGNKKDIPRAPRAPSLASRIGVTKRSSSTSSIPSPRLPPSRPSSTVNQNARANRLAAEINNTQTANLRTSQKTSGAGLSIKGAAAPFVVEARNFAPGTTDADIESAIQGDCIDSSGVNTLVSCRIVSTKPTVVAEMVFTERAVAETIIDRYHKQKADGRVLELRLARSGPRSISKQAPKIEEPAQPSPPPVVEPEIVIEEEAVMEDVEIEPEVPEVADAYDDERQAAERDRKDRESRRADRDEYEGSGRRRDDDRREERREERTRDREPRDRDSERDRTRDRGYERREERSYSRPEESRNSRQSHYGNGVGGGPRPGYNGGYGAGQGGYRGGRAYSDDARGGFGGRGGYRGGFRGYR